ncbi:hypothetical protein WJ0W_006846 [Paenibacillus melissococcoides]|uniref:Uncharacterized protein n=1 Tax=Paenibacillus melissococcoides TaxID=2912268 RepID=A0ABM9GC02_9BACL|nr:MULTISPECIES: hypothetical protein [Paenibacillus]MEB9897631.1 hypothetical protein [Bacillus cereus]CAH8249662.1 hypothetical protein WJ0W_006846 [Paenibacillus melissococcoides]CAH8721487.1 hypothetical protein WDD9_006317 [Paenibacillus melissococcoides]CAH8721732.1 hypothetical protein HTL2_006509 [Paenibacillus melissococcoides]
MRVYRISALPFVRNAFEAHLARIPSERNGIGIIEQFTLESVSAGTHQPYELFMQVGDRLHVLGMGELEYCYRLKKMSEEPSPLPQIEGLTAFPDYHDSVPSFRQYAARLTDLGQQVLTGEAN